MILLFCTLGNSVMCTPPILLSQEHGRSFQDLGHSFQGLLSSLVSFSWYCHAHCRGPFSSFTSSLSCIPSVHQCFEAIVEGAFLISFSAMLLLVCESYFFVDSVTLLKVSIISGSFLVQAAGPFKYRFIPS